ELVQFLLVKDQKKIPIKRADMLKNVIREYRGAYTEIINRAGRTLQEVFGLQLVEIDPKRHSYILASKLPCAEGNHPCRVKEKEKMGLLVVILSFIFMKGNSVKDSDLAGPFIPHRRAPLHPPPPRGSRGPPGAGGVQNNPPKSPPTHRYLEITPIPLTDPPQFTYQWGARAAKETSKRDLLNFVAKVQGKRPDFWTSQYNEAMAPP
ncbi:NSE3 protein, partial [Smithornis capensis]|nr:NSE3 protein [Smithornis capensis]